MLGDISARTLSDDALWSRGAQASVARVNYRGFRIPSVIITAAQAKHHRLPWSLTHVTTTVVLGKSSPPTRLPRLLSLFASFVGHSLGLTIRLI